MTASNGTIIFREFSGTPFKDNVVFLTFCPIGVCTDLVTLNITMNDSFGDGWNGNILGFKQSNLIVGTFGGNFTTGTSSGPTTIVVLGKFDIQIVVT